MPQPLVVTVETWAVGGPSPESGGRIENVVTEGQRIKLQGWALLSDTDAASLRIVSNVPVTLLYAGRDARSDVTTAKDDRRLIWSGFVVQVQTDSPPKSVELCVISEDPLYGSHTVDGSSTALCRPS